MIEHVKSVDADRQVIFVTLAWEAARAHHHHSPAASTNHHHLTAPASLTGAATCTGISAATTAARISAAARILLASRTTAGSLILRLRASTLSAILLTPICGRQSREVVRWRAEAKCSRHSEVYVDRTWPITEVSRNDLIAG